MRVFETTTGREIKPGDTLTYQGKPWQDPETFVFGAPDREASGVRDHGRIRLTDARGDNTYRPANQFDLVVVPGNEAYAAERVGSTVQISIFGRGLTAHDADKIARRMLPGVRLAGTSNSAQTVRRIYARSN